MIEFDYRRARVENFKYLIFVSLGILGNFGVSQLLARFGFAGSVADHSGEIADEKHDVVPQVLELAHLVQHDRVAQVQVGRGRVEAELDPQWHAVASDRASLASQSASGNSSSQPRSEVVIASRTRSVIGCEGWREA